MGVCGKRKMYLTFLTITVLQIITTGARQTFDFLGPLWSMILSNFLNIVFCIFGFFGGYTKRKSYLLAYVLWSMLWIGWNSFIIVLYLLPSLEEHKTLILSLGTSGYSWWETRAPGCILDWKSGTKFRRTNCYLNPKIAECSQAVVQVFLAIIGVVSALIFLMRRCLDGEDKGPTRLGPFKPQGSGKLPYFMTGSRSNNNNTYNRGNNNLGSSGGTHSRSSGRAHKSRQQQYNITNSSNNGDSSDQHLSENILLDERLRPMTPRKVKRRSARSIQSQKYGQSSYKNDDRNVSRDSLPGTSGSNRGSLRSNSSSRRSSNSRNSKRKSQQQFISPINRLMQQQLDSETSHDEPNRNKYAPKEAGHVNPVYTDQQSPHPTTPRPPSARSSYSNYHPARLPVNNAHLNANSNVLNLNQNIFSNPVFDHSPEYPSSQQSNMIHDDDMNFNPDNLTVTSSVGPSSPSIVQMPPYKNPPPNRRDFSGINRHGYSNVLPPNSPQSPPSSQYKFSFGPPRVQKMPTTAGMLYPQNGTDVVGSRSDNVPLAYPLAHSPVSQESFPLWGSSNQIDNRDPSSNIMMNQLNVHRRPMNQSSYSGPPPPRSKPEPYRRPQPINSETVI